MRARNERAGGSAVAAPQAQRSRGQADRDRGHEPGRDAGLQGGPRAGRGVLEVEGDACGIRSGAISRRRRISRAAAARPASATTPRSCSTARACSSASTRGGPSAIAGTRRVKMLDGARYRWAAEGRPLVTEEPPPAAPVSYTPVKRVERMRIHRDKVLAALAQGRHRHPRRALAGGIPRGARRRARRVPTSGRCATGGFRARSTSISRSCSTATRRSSRRPNCSSSLAARGAAPERDIIAYCRMSHRATVLYFALTQLLGFKKVKVYDGSWTEWGNLVGVPVER